MSAPGVRGQTFDEKGELPPGWKTKVDPAKKRRFYYNRDKNVTSWHRPKPEEAAPAIEKWEPDVEQPPAPAPAPAPDPKKTTAAKGAKLRVKLHGDLAEKHGERILEFEFNLTETVNDIKKEVAKRIHTDFEMVVMADQLTLSAYTNNAVDKLDSRVTAAEVFDKVKAQKRIALKKDTLKTLKAKATQLGFTSGTLHNIDEEDDPKEALIERLLAKMVDSKTESPYHIEVDHVAGGCIGGHGSCMEWTCCFFFSTLGIIFMGLLLAMGMVVFFFREDVEEAQHFMFIGSFFGVLASCSMVCCIWFLLPRYTEKRGVRGDQKQIEALARETWIWSFQLNGIGAKVKAVIALWLISLKFMQLFTLTYDSAAIDSLPDWAIEVGSYTLFKFDDLLKDQNSTANLAIEDALSLGTGNNYTAGATELLGQGVGKVTGYFSDEDSYQNMTFFYLGICSVMVVLIVVCFGGGCLEGRGSEFWQNFAIGLVGFIANFATLPLYDHLLSGLDCTFEKTGRGPFGNESGFMWDGATDAFGGVEGAGLLAGDGWTGDNREWIANSKESCYGKWSDWNDFENWTAFNYMIFGMIGVCMFQWPITMYLMLRPDSERDDNQAVDLIVDAIIRAKELEGRKMTNFQKDGQDFPAVDPKVGTPRGLPDNFDDKYEDHKGCCAALKPKPGYENAKIEYTTSGSRHGERGASRALEEFEKLWVIDEKTGDRTPQMNRLRLRQYAKDSGVSPEQIDRIDHRRRCGTKDLDSADLGIKGPKKRPREAAVNFGMEVAIVVISALFSGSGEIPGDVAVGEFCTDPHKFTSVDSRLLTAPAWAGEVLEEYPNFFSDMCGGLLTKEDCESTAGTMYESANVATDAGLCVWGARPLSVMETKLVLLGFAHLFMALYFCNPFTLLRGEVCCSPYRDKDQTDSRTSVCHLGYPYNYEPLNFVRGATSLICASFAAFEILSFRKVFAEQDKDKSEEEDGLAMVYWVYSCIGIVGFYTAMMLIRWCVFSSHRRRTMKKDEAAAKAADDRRATSQP